MANLELGDIKYYYLIHCSRQQIQGEDPVSYAMFCKRLKYMNLHDAIYTPRGYVNNKHGCKKNTINDDIRRKKIENEENIQVLHFEHIKEAEVDKPPHIVSRAHRKARNRVIMPKPKQTLLSRFISLFR